MRNPSRLKPKKSGFYSGRFASTSNVMSYERLNSRVRSGAKHNQSRCKGHIRIKPANYGRQWIACHSSCSVKCLEKATLIYNQIGNDIFFNNASSVNFSIVSSQRYTDISAPFCYHSDASSLFPSEGDSAYTTP